MSQHIAPRRELSVNFTEQTFRRSIAAKERQRHWQHIKRIFMNIPQFVKQPMGAAIAVAAISLSAVGAYAAVNWFNGTVQVSQKDASVLSVDLSSCKGNLPPGVDNTDRHNVQFKILGNPHISAKDLQQALLEQCEYDATVAFFKAQPTAGNSTEAATVTATSPSGIAFAYKWGDQMHTRQIATADLHLFKQGTAATLADFHIGDHIVVNYDLPTPWSDTQGDPVAAGTMRGVFKTQYDVTQAPEESKKAFYSDYNIMPLDSYNQVHDKLHI